MIKHNGCLIAIEGISGVGKTTFAKILSEKFIKKNINVAVLGGFNICQRSSDITRFCRELVEKKRFFDYPLLSEIHLLMSEIIMDIEKNVKPLLNQGAVVLYDNYIYSILAVEIARIRQTCCIKKSNTYIEYLKNTINNYINISNMPRPDCTIYLTCTIDQIVERLKKRDKCNVTEEQKQLLRMIAIEYNCILDLNKTIIVESNGKIEQEINSSYQKVMEIF
ncbi:deoxynucleoside kinase [Abyssisolibacter fermentans]|uniref:deoxynucleoside kinase n=1 Tax=Abyssisolibacter fermentans TaxID=1766203 RepID=UPI00082D665A|nr:deoxynucleoside kinase [Abyssisolibacter fermentans]